MCFIERRYGKREHIAPFSGAATRVAIGDNDAELHDTTQPYAYENDAPLMTDSMTTATATRPRRFADLRTRPTF